MKPIHVFTNEIKEGQVFIAHVDSVEGRDRVTLVPDNDYYVRQENPEAYEDRRLEEISRQEYLEDQNRDESKFEDEMTDEELQELRDRQQEEIFDGEDN